MATIKIIWEETEEVRKPLFSDKAGKLADAVASYLRHYDDPGKGKCTSDCVEELRDALRAFNQSDLR